MDGRPLGYESQMVILQYMEASKRFVITKHMPSLRTADRVTPLTIKSLAFKQYGLEINGTNYSLRIHQQKQEGRNPAQIDNANQQGTTSHDLDQYGLEDPFAEDVITPGDLEIQKRDQRYDAWIDRTRMVQMLQLEIDNLVDRKEILENQEDEEKCEKLEKKIEHRRVALVPYNCFRDQRPSPYDFHIQLRQTDLDENINLERFVYNKKLPEAMKYFTTKLFGNRRHPIKVGRLVIDNDNKYAIRLPEGLKIKVNELDVNDILRASCLRPILLNSQVEHMHLRNCQFLESTVETLKMAQSLIIDSLIDSDADWLSIFQELQNKEIFLRETLNLDSYLPLIRYWIEHGKPAGTRYTFVFSDLIFSNFVKDQIMRQLGGLTLTMRNQCKLVISFKKTTAEKAYGLLQEGLVDSDNPWFMTMAVTQSLKS